MDTFHRVWIYGLLVFLIVKCCIGCGMILPKPEKKHPVETTLNILKKYCEFQAIRFKDDTETPMLDEVTCFAKLKQVYGIP